jgi:hypothetical protein
LEAKGLRYSVVGDFPDPPNVDGSHLEVVGFGHIGLESLRLTFLAPQWECLKGMGSARVLTTVAELAFRDTYDYQYAFWQRVRCFPHAKWVWFWEERMMRISINKVQWHSTSGVTFLVSS